MYRYLHTRGRYGISHRSCVDNFSDQTGNGFLASTHKCVVDRIDGPTGTLPRALERTMIDFSTRWHTNLREHHSVTTEPNAFSFNVTSDLFVNLALSLVKLRYQPQGICMISFRSASQFAFSESQYLVSA